MYNSILDLDSTFLMEFRDEKRSFASYKAVINVDPFAIIVAKTSL